MPANRSRTAQWRRGLEQIKDRQGAIEIALAGDAEDENHRHLVWRVRVLDLTEDAIVVEQPSTLGKVMPIKTGASLTAILAIGQNRWMFTTTNVAGTGGGRYGSALQLKMPTTVTRCQRRNHYRVSTTAINLPEVEIWPLLDPKSVVVAERANELLASGGRDAASAGDMMMPEVGPRFHAMLLNIGGGGVGIRVEQEYSQVMSRQKLFWVRFALAPAPATPICATAKLVHTHMQSDQRIYGGLAFDFTFNPQHQAFVVDQISAYIKETQGESFNDTPHDAAV